MSGLRIALAGTRLLVATGCGHMELELAIDITVPGQAGPIRLAVGTPLRPDIIELLKPHLPPVEDMMPIGTALN